MNNKENCNCNCSHQKHNSLNIFLLGVIVGAAIIFLFATKKGKKILKLISEEGLDNLTNLIKEDELDELLNEEENSSKEVPEEPVLKTDGEVKEVSPKKRRFFKKAK
jgi:gas vesicle protein